MITFVRIGIGMIWVLSLLAGRGVWSSSWPVDASSAGGPDTTAVSDGVKRESTSVGDDRQERRLDLFGNEIETAVTDYRVDGRGGTYERHSPDTAVPRLGSPVS